MTKKQFERIDFTHVTLDKPTNTYYVYKGYKTDPVEVEAETTFEAVAKSGINSPSKVIRIQNVLTESSVVNSHLIPVPNFK